MPDLDPEQLAPELISTGADALVQNAKRLGMTWSLRKATVTESGASVVAAIYYGDTVAIDMVSMIGSVASGQRVYVIQVPPSGNFIVGVDGQIAGPGFRAFTGSQVDTGSIGAETVVLTSSAITWENGRAYSIEYHHPTEPAAANSFGHFRVRRTNLAGAIIGEGVHPLPLSGLRTTCQHRLITRNVSGFDIINNIVVTLAGGFANVTGRGSADSPRWVEIRDIGDAGDYANCNTFG